MGLHGDPLLNMDVVLLFPGQGSQKPGMGKDLYDHFPEARAVFDESDAELGIPLSRLCFDGPAEALTLTQNAQPALFSHGAAVWAVLAPAIEDRVVAAAGHSLGEFTAYHAAGALGLASGLRLVRRRGELMGESAKRRPGAMAAILGTLGQSIEGICAVATREVGLVVPANYNGPGQIVVSGEVAGVERAMALARNAGAKRAIRLNVSGAFHSPLMQTASEGLMQAVDSARLGSPRWPIYANVDAGPVTTVHRARKLLLEQLTSPVRWCSVVQALACCYPEALFLELGPGNVLSGLAKKIAPSVTTATCGSAAETRDVLGRLV